jgi:hypothetical protein
MAIQVGFEIDVAGFKRGIAQVRQGTLSMAADITTVMRGAAAIFQTGANVVQGAAQRMYDAMSQGGELVDLSERTGLAVDKLMELQVAFDQAGLGAAEVGPLVNKMQNAIADAAAGSATGQKTFTDLGLSLEELGTMDAAAQMETIGNAIAGIEDPVRRTQASMDIFGKSGGKMLALFASGGLGGAQEALGGQAQLMAQNAAYFDEITDKLGTAALKVQGFFVGMASALVPDLMAAADAINGIKLDQIGAQIGNSFAVIIELFKSNQLGEAFVIGMQIGALKVANIIQSFLTKAIVMAVSPFLMLAEPGFWSGMLSALQSGFMTIIGVLQIGIGEAVKTIGGALGQIPGMKGAGAAVSAVGAGIVDMGELNLEDAQARSDAMGQNFAEAISNAGEMALGMFDNIDQEPFANRINELTGELSGMLQTAQENVTAARAGLPKVETEKGGGAGLTVTPPAGGKSQSFEAITSSMARIGGGGLTAGLSFTVSPMVDQQKETNRLLKRQNELQQNRQAESQARYA